MYKLAICLLVLSITACSSTGQLTADQRYKLIAEYSSKKTFEISCETGCTVSYKDPRDQLALPNNTNGWDVAKEGVKVLGGVATAVAPFVALTGVVEAGFKAAGNNVSGSYNSSSTESTNTTSTQSTSYDSSYNSDLATE